MMLDARELAARVDEDHLPMKTFFRIAAVGAVVTALLSACGGGTGQIEAFQPGRILVFGDEHSAFTPDGRRYAVNGLNADGSLNCELNPIWVQVVATAYGLRFAQCQGTATEALAINFAAPGARVADVRAQIDTQAGSMREKDLVLMMAGLNDVVQLYESRTSTDTDEQLLQRSRELGQAMADQVNRLVGLGARVVIATMPDVGLTPWGLARGAAGARLLTQMSLAFNGRLRVGVLNDGRFVGLILADESLQSAATVPAAFGLVNWTEPVCLPTAPVPNCTNAASSLVSGVTETTYLWADSKLFGTTLHRQIGAIAVDRASRNPF
jgi:outer membrane lipase/esterase